MQLSQKVQRAGFAEYHGISNVLKGFGRFRVCARTNSSSRINFCNKMSPARQFCGGKVDRWCSFPRNVQRTGFAEYHGISSVLKGFGRSRVCARTNSSSRINFCNKMSPARQLFQEKLTGGATFQGKFSGRGLQNTMELATF